MESNRKRRTMNDRRLLTRLPNVRSGGAITIASQD